MIKKLLNLFIVSLIVTNSFCVTNIIEASANTKKEFYVSSAVETSGDGTFEKPFASISKAKQAIRDLKSSEGLPEGGVTVYIRGGVYPVYEEMLFTVEDSGTESAPIVYKAYENEKPVFSGGITIEGNKFTPISETDKNRLLTETAKDKIVCTSLLEYGISDYGYSALKSWGVAKTSVLPPVEAFIGDTALDMARYPNKENGRPQYLYTGEVISNPYGSGNSDKNPVFEYNDERIEKWQSFENTAVHGLFPWPYFFEGHGIKEINKNNNTLTLSTAGFYGINKGNRYYYVNVFEELDCENEYYIDTQNHILYLYAPENIDDISVSLTIMGSDYDEAMFHFYGASYITLSGLEITLARTHGVWIQGGRNVLIENCDIKNIGLRGVTIGCIGFSESQQATYVRGWRATDKSLKTRAEYEAVAGYNHGVDNCRIYNCGDGGVKMYGGDRVELEPCGYFLKNSIIHDVDRFHTTYGYAVFMVGVGIYVGHNTIYNTQQCAVQTACNDSVFEYNELYNCLTEGADMGIIYNTAYNGEIEAGFEIRYNYCHDTPNEVYPGEHDWAGDTVYRCFVYKDNGNSFQNVHHNLVVNVPRGVNNVGGNGVNWYNNVFVDVKLPINLGYNSSRLSSLMSKGNTRDGTFNCLGSNEFLVFAELPAWQEKHPEVKKTMDLLLKRGNKAYYEDKKIMNNLIVYLDTPGNYTQKFSWAAWESEYCTIYNNKFFKTNPGFSDAENNNYEISDDKNLGIDLSWLEMDMFGVKNN